MKIKIIFRELVAPLPPDWSEGLHWQVEAWDAERDCSRPLGVAWVTAFTGVVPPYLDYVIVCDDFRRQGVASALVAACRKRWPNIELTDAISSAGEALLAAIDREGP